MQKRAISAGIVLIVGWVVLTILLGDTMFALIVKVLLLPILAYMAAMTKGVLLADRIEGWIKPKLGGGAEARVTTVQNRPDGKIVIMGLAVDRPPLLDAATGLFDRERAVPAFYAYRNESGIGRAGIPPLKRTELNERRMFESLIESARFEYARRGGPIHNRTNKIIWPDIYHDGIEVERIKNDDGSTSHILAVGLLDPLNKEDWQKAHAAGIGRQRSAWFEKPYALTDRQFISWGKFDDFDKPGAGVFPLFYCDLMEVVMPATEAVDPLARNDGGVSYDFPEEWR